MGMDSAIRYSLPTITITNLEKRILQRTYTIRKHRLGFMRTNGKCNNSHALAKRYSAFRQNPVFMKEENMK